MGNTVALQRSRHRWGIKQDLLLVVLLLGALAASGCSQPAAPTPPAQIAVQADAEQAIEYLASVVKMDDPESARKALAQRHGDPSDIMAMLLANKEDVPAWLRSRTLVNETPGYFVYELAAVGELRVHRIRVHRRVSEPEGMSDEGIEF